MANEFTRRREPLSSAAMKRNIKRIKPKDEDYAAALEQKENLRDKYVNNYLKENNLKYNTINVDRASDAFEQVYKTDYSNLYNELEKYQKRYNESQNYYHFGDITNFLLNADKKILNTGADLGLDILEGGLGYAEGGIDALTYLGADIIDGFGGTGLAKDLRSRADFNSTAQIFGKNANVQQNFGDWTRGIEEESFAPDFVDQIFQGVGQVATAGLTAGALGGSVLQSAGVTFASSYGNARSEAKRNGASDADAHKAGLISAAAETLSEQFFDAVPGMKVEGWGSKLTGKLSDFATKYFGEKTGKAVLKVADSLGEGFEEILSNAFQAAGNDIVHYFDENYTYGMENQTGNILEDVWNQFTSSDSWQQFASAAITSAIVNGAKGRMDNATRKNIINAYAQDNNMSYEDAEYILTGEMQEQAKQEAIRDKVDYDSQVELSEIAQGRVYNYAQQTNSNYINSQIDAMEKARGQEFTEEERQGLFDAFKNRTEEEINSPERYRNFKLDEKREKKLSNEDRELYESFIKNSNDTQAAHELFDFYKKLREENPNARYQLTSNDELVEMGLLEKQGDKYGRTITKDGKQQFVEETINGLNAGDRILINRDGLNAMEATTIHEIAHSIKDSSPEGYKSLTKMVHDILGEDDYNQYKEKYADLYGDEENLEDEYINDKLGELLNKEEFINKLKGNRNLLQRILDKVKELLNYVTSSGQKRQLIKMQSQLEKAYKELYGKAKFEGAQDAKYSLSQDSQGRELSQEQQENINKFTDNGILMSYVKNPQSNASQYKEHYKNVGLDFGQDIEPSGEYMSMDTLEGKNKIDGYEYGYIDFKNPLVINNADTTSNGWKKDLSNMYNGLTGQKLSNAIMQDGYDAVMSRDNNGNIVEVVNLNGTKINDQTKYSSNFDIRYSLSPKGDLVDQNGNKAKLETTPSVDNNLMVLHGLSTSNLKNVLSLGGLPVPSLGITDASNSSVLQEFSGSNGVMLIFDKDTINPKNKQNEVYSRDVYSKTIPEIYQKTDKRALNKIMDEFRPYESEYGSFNKHDYTKSSLDSIVNDMLYQDAAKAKFLEDNGYSIEKVYRNYKSSYGFTEEVIDKFVEEHPDLAALNPYSTESSELSKLAPQIKDIALDMMVESDPKTTRKQLETLFNDDWHLQDVIDFYHDIKGYMRLNGQKEFDSYATRDNIRNMVEEHETEYEQWLRDKFEPIYGEKYFENDSGRKYDYTLENLTSYMKKGGTKAQQKGLFDSFGIGQAKAGAAEQYMSIDEIKEASKKLVDAETYKERHDAFEQIDEDVRTEIGDSRISQGEDLFEVYSDYYMALSKAASGTNAEIALQINHFDNLTKEQIEKFREVAKALYELPAKYFEAKPQREVTLNEIKGIVIPNTIDAGLRQQLLDNGFTLAEYNPNIEGDQQRAVNEFEQYKFSLSDNAPQRGYGTYTEDITNNMPVREAPNLPTTQEVEASVEAPDEELPFYEADENLSQEDRMAERRRKFADERIKKMMEKQTYKSAKEATKIAKNYLGFNQKETEAFKNQITKLSKLAKDNLIKAKNYNDLKDTIRQYATKDQTFINQEIKDAQKEIRNTQLIVSDDLKAQITDWSDFRKSSGLNIRKGVKSNVDTIYEELLESYPGMLDSSITNYADQLQELSDFLKRDNKYVEHFELSEDSINNITNRVWEKLSNNALTKQEIKDLQDEITQKAERRTREVVQQDLLETMGLTEQDIQVGKDISSIAYQRTDPRRLNEKVFGYDVGQKINQATNGFVQHQEANKIRWQNKERAEIEDLGIKARSKMSAAVQKYGEKQYVNDKGELVEYNDQTLMSEFPNVQDQEKIKNAARVLRQKYDDYIDRMNDALTDMGYDPVPKRKDYFRHFMELDDKLSQFGFTFSKENIMKEDLPTDINGLTDQFKPGKNYFASAMTRKGLKTTYDAITGIDQYLEGVGNVIYHTESIQRYRALSKLIRETYGQTHGTDNIELMTPEEAEQRIQDIYDNKLSRYAAWLDEQANALAGKKAAIDRSLERVIGRKGYTLLNGLKKQVGSNMTGYNVRSAMTNFASAIQGASKTQKLSALQGFAFALKNYRNIDPLVEKSDFLATRFGTDALSKKTWQKMSEAGQVFMNATDRFTTLQIWGGKYFEGLNHGLSEEAAIQNADNFAARIMGDRSKGQTAEIFNSKTLGLLTQFQLEVNNQWSSMIHDNKMAMQQNPGLKAGLHIANQLGQLYAASWFFNNFMKAVTGSDVMFDPIDILMGIFNPDDEDEDLESRTTKALGKLVNQLPMASIFTGGRIPISEAFKGVDTGFKYITGQKDIYGNNYTLDDVKDDFLGSLAYYVMPTGYGQLKKTTQGLGMYANELPGSYTSSGRLRFEADTSPLGVLQSALFGQYASGEAREYFDKGLMPLTEKQIQEVKDVNLPVSEYREIRQGMKEAANQAKEDNTSQSEAKVDYIYNLPLNSTQKNILANNTLNRKEDVDISDYGKYGSLEEFDYANKNPKKYQTITQITNYETYQTYKDDIADIKKQYTNKNDRKAAVFDYINSQSLNKEQKIMLYRMAGGYSIKNYEEEMYKYINGLQLSKQEKENIYKELFN